MTTEKFDGVAVATKANVYFDGKCVSHGITLADGTKKSVGVILPATLTFNTGAPEIMECVAGSCEYKLAGSSEWKKSGAGEKFSVPGQLQLRDPRGRRLPLHLPLRLNGAIHEHHPRKPAPRAEGRHRLLRRPGHQRGAALDAQEGRDPLRVHRQPGPARRAGLRRDPAQGHGVRRREGAPGRLPQAAGARRHRRAAVRRLPHLHRGA